MTRAFQRLKETPSQTAGPYVHIGATPNFADITGVYQHDLGHAIMSDQAKGQRIVITGQVFDGAGAPLKDALLEIWQADANGLYPGKGDHRGIPDANFRGWARQAVDAASGTYRFETIKPGIVPYFDGRPMAPHVTVWIVARGINIGLHTRLYFSDENAANKADPVLARIENRARAATLIAHRAGSDGIPAYTFDIHLQGEKETVFLDI